MTGTLRNAFPPKRTRQWLAWQPVVFSLSGFVLACGAIFALLYAAATHMNRDAKALSNRLALTAIQVVSEELEGRILEYAWWDITVEQVEQGIDPDWAADNIGEYLADAFGYSGSFIVGREGATVFAYQANEDSPASAEALWGQAFSQFLKTVNDTDMLETQPLSGFVRFGNDIWLVSAGAITPEDPTEEQLQPAPRAIFVLHQKLDAAFLLSLGDRYGFDGLSISERTALGTGIRLKDQLNTEPAGYLVWQQRTPGDDLIYEVLPWVIGIVAVLLIAASTIYLLWLKTAVEASAAKSQILAKMSHEFRTPLNPILGFSELMANETMGPLSPHYRGYAEDIHQGGRHLRNLVEELLDLSKIEAGKLELQDTIVDVEQVVEVVTHLAGGQPGAHGGTGPLHDAKPRIVSSVADGVPHLKADELRLRQVLINILSNAAKFSDGQPIEVRVDEDNGAVRIEVEDHGSGIAEDELGRVLQPFEQASKLSPEKAIKGTGLGLAISRELMRLHGGDLTLESELGKGTRVTLLFPRGRSVAA